MIGFEKYFMAFRRRVCANCKEEGHTYRGCHKPIISYGIIAIKNKENPEILMVQRKDSMGFVEFIRGRYNTRDLVQISNLLCEMTVSEVDKILTVPFESLWSSLWVNHNSRGFKYCYPSAKEKFDEVHPLLLDLIQGGQYSDTEWGIPKGRINQNETDYECAEREFYEETNYNPLVIDEHRVYMSERTFIEDFTGTNKKHYIHLYYLLVLNESTPLPSLDYRNKNQVGEIKDIQWFSEEDAIRKLKSRDREKKRVIREAFSYYRSLSESGKGNVEMSEKGSETIFGEEKMFVIEKEQTCRTEPERVNVQETHLSQS